MLEPAGFHIQDGDRSLAGTDGGHDAVANPFFVARFRPELVDDQLDEMRFVAVKGLDVCEIPDLSVNAHLGVSPLAKPFQQFAVMAFPSLDKRGEENAFPATVDRHDEVDDLRIRVTDHLLSADGRIGP